MHVKFMIHDSLTQFKRYHWPQCVSKQPLYLQVHNIYFTGHKWSITCISRNHAHKP